MEQGDSESTKILPEFSIGEQNLNTIRYANDRMLIAVTRKARTN